VWVDLERDHNRISIGVRDRGLGIPVNEQRDVFEKFVRGADSKARRIKGTGIGLAMVRHIVQAHGGEILLVSQPGEGSRFTIVISGEAQLQSVREGDEKSQTPMFKRQKNSKTQISMQWHVF
jgi:signal transduction histidine kinase